MCNEWFKEFKAWCKSFTRTEVLLALLEAFLLIVCIGFLIFLILHFLACLHKQSDSDDSITPPWGTTTHGRHTVNKNGKKIVINKDLEHEKVDGDGQAHWDELVTDNYQVVVDGVPKWIGFPTTEGSGDNKRIVVNKLSTTEQDNDIQKKIVINKASTPAVNADLVQTNFASRKIVINKATTPNDGVVDMIEGNGTTNIFVKKEMSTLAELNFIDAATPTPTSRNTDVECTWQPSKKTTAFTHYYQLRKHTSPYYFVQKNRKVVLYAKPGLKPVAREREEGSDDTEGKAKARPATELGFDGQPEGAWGAEGAEEAPSELEALAYDDQSDGEEPRAAFRHFMLALVKLRAARDPQFGCPLTAVAARWVLTAASCLEAVEEVDSLDAFVMLEGYGEPRPGPTHAVADVRVHPMFQGANRSHDIAALRSSRPLQRLPPGGQARLPDLIDYFMITAAERFTVLGFGSYRTVSQRGWGSRALRAVHVYSLPARQCPAAGADVWALRHLARPRPAGGAGATSAGPLCCGVLYARGAPCGYCAGTPLLRGDTLMGVMADSAHCAITCEPALYVNVAAVRDWITAVINADADD